MIHRGVQLKDGVKNGLFEVVHGYQEVKKSNACETATRLDASMACVTGAEFGWRTATDVKM